MRDASVPSCPVPSRPVRPGVRRCGRTAPAGPDRETFPEPTAWAGDPAVHDRYRDAESLRTNSDASSPNPRESHAEPVVRLDHVRVEAMRTDQARLEGGSRRRAVRPDGRSVTVHRAARRGSSSVGPRTWPSPRPVLSCRVASCRVEESPRDVVVELPGDGDDRQVLVEPDRQVRPVGADRGDHPGGVVGEGDSRL